MNEPKLPAFKKHLKERPTEEEVFKVMDKMTRDSDRGSAIAAVAMIDDVLEGVVKFNLPRLSEDDEKFLFNPSGPLGSASVKARLASALGIIGPLTREDLDHCREIRNGFAHTTRDITFDDLEPLKNIVESLHSLKSVTGAVQPTRVRFVQACRILMLHLVAKMHSPSLKVSGYTDLD